jgi:NADP-dependent 3-hydroxy acid dehydrogenase YdfG
MEAVMPVHAIVSGAGSGVGQAVTLALLARGWSVSMFDLVESALSKTRAAAGTLGEKLDAYVLDVGDAAAVRRSMDDVLVKHAKVQALICAAGTNVPRRGLSELTASDFGNVVETNLKGTFHLVSAVLPAMRRQGSGSIVTIVSEAGLRANAKAGAAYVASKFAVSGLTQSINCEEQKHGVRATAIFPGDINTPLLDKRPNPPPVEARLTMLQPADVAACVLLALELPQNAVVEQLVVTPRSTG